MQKNTDGTVVLTQAEMKSLSRLVKACHDAISRLSSDGDFLGWDNYRALQMWDSKLHGENYDLTDFIDEEEEESSKKKKPATVDEWLNAYGKKK
jgi:hypothetical protein